MWFRVDDQLGSSAKVLRIPRAHRGAAMGLWVLAGAWCGQQLTDGALPGYLVDELGGTEESADWLVTVGLWEKTPEGYHFHDWEQANPTKAEVEADRAAGAERQRKSRRGVTRLSRVTTP